LPKGLLNLHNIWIRFSTAGHDDTDLATLTANLGASSATHSQGDLNGDGHVDVADRDLMFAQYGLNLDVVV
jgi:hypothetical protein